MTSHIESILMKIYKDGDIGTLESTLELKEQIFAKEKSFHYSDSKAAKSILFRQHFLELGPTKCPSRKSQKTGSPSKTETTRLQPESKAMLTMKTAS